MSLFLSQGRTICLHRQLFVRLISINLTMYLISLFCFDCEKMLSLNPLITNTGIEPTESEHIIEAYHGSLTPQFSILLAKMNVTVNDS